MKNIKTCITLACVAAATLMSSCNTEQQLSSPSLSYNNSHDPHFIDNITLGDNGTGINMSVATRNDKIKEQIKVKSSELVTLQKKYASLLGVLPQSITNISLYKFIDDWYGVQYRWGGDDKSGIDCSAFVQKLYEHVFGSDLLRTAIEQFSTCRFFRSPSKLKEGDLVFFHIHSRHITHVGIYLKNHYFVHASASEGVTISSLDSRYWRHYYAGGGEISKNNG